MNAHVLSGQVAGEGTSFTVVLPFTSYSSTPSAEKVRLYLTSRLGSRVTVRYGSGGGVVNRVVPAGGLAQVDLDTAGIVLPRQQGVFRRLLKVTSDNPVTLSVLLDRGTASEAYAAIPDSLCGYEYVAVAETSEISGSFVTVAALEDDTKVTFTPSTITKNGDPPGVPFDVMIDRGEVYQLISPARIDVIEDDDISGTHVVADRPIVVHSGSSCVVLPIGSNSSCAPLLEQLPHVDALGTTYVLPLFRGEERTLMRAVPVCAPVRLLSDDLFPPVDIMIDGDSGTNVETYSSGLVRASERVLLAHLGTNISKRPNGLDGPVGDPTLSVLVPLSQMDTLFSFVVPLIAGRVDPPVAAPWLHFVTVVRTDLRTTATLNGRPLTFNNLVADTLVEPGLYLVESDGPVSVNPNGRSISDAYAMVPGQVTHPFDVRGDTVHGIACFGGFDTVITVRNDGPAAIGIDRAEFLNGLSGSVTTSLPVIVRRGDSLEIPLHFEGSLDSIRGRIILYNGTGPCARRIGEIPVRLRGFPLQLDPGRGATIRFPDLRPPNRTQDTTIVLRNVGTDTVDITDIVIETDRFVLLSQDRSFRLAPGEVDSVRVRFTPQPGDDLEDGFIRFLTEPCPQDMVWTIHLQGKVRYFDVFGPAELRDTVYCGVAQPDTLQVRVANYESLPLTIDSLRIRGGGAGEFTIINSSVDDVRIGPGDTLVVSVLYIPGSTGRREGQLELHAGLVDFMPYSVPIAVVLEAYEFEFIPAGLDFGPLDCDTAGVRRLLLRNRGTVPLRGYDAGLHHGDHFAVSRGGPDPPGPGDTLQFILQPIGPPGEHRDTLRFFESICGTDLLLPTHVVCIDSGSFSLEIPNLSGTIGERIEIPISIDRSDPTYGSGVPIVLDIMLRLRGDLFAPSSELLGLPPNMSARIVGTQFDGIDRLLSLRFEGVFPSGALLGRIPGTLLLGEVAGTPVAFEEVRFEFDISSEHFRTGVTTVDGSIEVDGYCEIGGPRFIRTSGAFGLKVAPSIAGQETSLLLDLVEDSPISVELFDALGRRVEILYGGDPGSGRWSIPIDISRLPQGTYRIRLSTTTQVAGASLVVIGQD